MKRVSAPLRTALLVIGWGLASLTGCGGRDVAQVSGRVQYKGGQPLDAPVKTIRFEPTPDTTAEIRKAAQGEIAEDGSFELYTRKPGDGVFRGKYGVTFTVMTRPMGGESLIKRQYETLADTPYVVEVDGNMSGLLYELEPK